MGTFAYLSVIGIALFILYTGISLLNFGIPKSLSYTYYLWLKKDSKLKWPFRLALIATAALLMAPMIQLGEDSAWQFTGFLTPFGLAMVGAASEYDNEKSIDRWWHPVSAIICAISGILWQYFVAEMIYFFFVTFSIALIIAWLTETIKRSYIFWAEMACFFGVFCCLIKIYFY